MAKKRTFLRDQRGKSQPEIRFTVGEKQKKKNRPGTGAGRKSGEEKGRFPPPQSTAGLASLADVSLRFCLFPHQGNPVPIIQVHVARPGSQSEHRKKVHIKQFSLGQGKYTTELGLEQSILCRKVTKLCHTWFICGVVNLVVIKVDSIPPM